MWDCSVFYTNRLLKESKDGGNALLAEWARALAAVMDVLLQFVKTHHTTGLAWGKQVRMRQRERVED